MGSNPASPTDNQDRFSDPDFLFSAAFSREILRPIDGCRFHSDLTKDGCTILTNSQIFAYIQRN